MPSLHPRPHPPRRPVRRLAVTAGSAMLAAAVAIVAAGCGSSAGGSSGPAAGAAGPPVRGGTLEWALAQDPLSLSPWGGGSGNDQLYVTRQIFDTLTEQDPATGKILPFLASKWTVNSDATQFTFTVRSGVTFSDGTRLTPRVIADNFDEIARVGAAATWVANDFVGYAGSTVTGPDTLAVKFSRPNAPFPQELSGVGIVGPNTLKIPYQDWATGQGLVGSGPFALRSYTQGQSVVLTRRAGYAWGPSDRANHGAAYLSGIHFKITPEPSVRTGVLTSRQVEGIDNVQPQDISTLRDDGFGILSKANPGIAFGLSFVQNTPVTRSLPVRQAIADAIDRTAIRNAVLTPDFAVATSVLSDDTVGYVNLARDLTYDPARAKRLLTAAGWVPGRGGIRVKGGQPLALTLGWGNNFAPNQNVLQLIQAELKQIGVQVTLQTGDVPQVQAGLKAGRYNLGWGNLSNSNAAVLRTQLSRFASNYYKLNDPVLEGDFAKEYASPDVSAQNAYAALAQQRILQQADVVPVFQLTTVLATSSRVHGVEFGADARLAQLTDAWVTGGA
ncbi:MAG: ABC transporter substrate-binding protein [Nocardiopsaceae bacterium]|nr:ABC transporter substrate-binding protein [Nocardiopsaceae bacterium]